MSENKVYTEHTEEFHDTKLDVHIVIVVGVTHTSAIEVDESVTTHAAERAIDLILDEGLYDA